MHREVNFPHHRLRTVIGKRNVFEADFTGELGSAQGSGRAFHLDGRIENFEYPPRTDQRLLHTVHNVDDVVDLSRKLFEQTGKDDQSGAEGQPVVRHEPAAVTEQNDDVDARQKTDRRRKQTQPPKNPALLVETGLVGSFKFSAIFGLAPKSFRHSDTLDALGQRLHHTFNEGPVVRVFGLNFPGKPRRHQPQHRRRRETGQRQTRMQARHVDHVNRERDDHNHALHEHLIDKHPHRLHIARHPGDDRARRVGIEETEAQPLKFFVHLTSQIDDEFLLHQHIDGNRVGVIEQRTTDREHENQTGDEAEHVERRPVRRERQMELVGRERRAVHFVPDIVNPQTRETEADDAHREQHELDPEHLEAVEPIAPSQPEQPTDQHPIEGRSGGGSVGRKGHMSPSLRAQPDGARNLFPLDTITEAYFGWACGGGGGLARRGESVFRRLTTS